MDMWSGAGIATPVAPARGGFPGKEIRAHPFHPHTRGNAPRNLRGHEF